MVKKAYSLETKLACIEMKKAGKSNKFIMDTLVSKIQVRSRPDGDGIRIMNCTISTNLWGYDKGMQQLSIVEQLRLQVELLKKYRNLVRQSIK